MRTEKDNAGQARITRIYTRSGDEGRTSLPDGERVEKTDPRIEAYGTLDELNSHAGLLAAELAGMQPQPPGLRDELHEIQKKLFGVGNGLDTRTTASRLTVDKTDAEHLEAAIDRMAGECGTARPQGFVLPGGCRAAAQAHVCRAVCRRAERRLCATGMAGTAAARTYLNRLSDYFYALACYLNHFYNIPERNL